MGVLFYCVISICYRTLLNYHMRITPVTLHQVQQGVSEFATDYDVAIWGTLVFAILLSLILAKPLPPYCVVGQKFSIYPTLD